MTIENLTHHAHILNIVFFLCRCLSYFTTLSSGVLSGLHWKVVVLSAQVKGFLRYLVGQYRHSLPFYCCIADSIDSSELRSLCTRVPGLLECFAPISMATSALCIPGTCLQLIPVCWVEHLLLGITCLLHYTSSPHFVGFLRNSTRSSRLFQSPCSIGVWALQIILPTVSGTLLSKYSTG